ncbi:hypothetical protein DWW31_14050 [Clostridium sp. AF15-17LB]|nr:hypothetical protein DWW31_14050 [Clostridium sp. AF15-17LB]
MKSCRLCKEDFEEVKQRLSMRKVAESYGFKVDGRGFCLCPFHADSHPSMKIYQHDKGYFCFTCNSGGDVVKFVAGLFNLRNEEACRKLIEDFSLPIMLEDLTYQEKRERQKRQERYRELQKFKAEAYAILNSYRILLCGAANSFASLRFEEALQELSIIEYRMECLERCPEEYHADRKAVKKLGEIERRVAGWDG